MRHKKMVHHKMAEKEGNNGCPTAYRPQAIMTPNKKRNSTQKITPEAALNAILITGCRQADRIMFLMPSL